MMAERPDLILLVLDTQRADRLSCYGYERETTPAIDALAQRATRFAAPVAPAQWTAPTHASLFTGLYPSQHTVHQMNSVLPASLPTLAQRLAAVGYHTVGFSQNPLIGLVKNDLARGFHQFESVHLLSNILLTTRGSRPEGSVGAGKRLELGLRWLLAEALGYSYETPLQRLAPLLAPLWQRLLQARGRSKSASTAGLLDAAARILIDREGLAPDQPIFLFINLMGAHIPYDPDRDILARYLPPGSNVRQSSGLLRWANQLQIDVDNWLDAPLAPAQRALLDAIYDAEVATQDAQVDAFLEKLGHARRLEQSFLAVVADHGDHLGDKDRVNHAFGVYQPLVHVPLIIHDPLRRLAPGTVRNEAVSTRRLFHTLLEAAGAATAQEAALSLSKEADGAHAEPSDVIVSEGYPLEWALGRLQGAKARVARAQGHTQTARALRRAHYKLITNAHSAELYDLAEDGAERRDVSDLYPERVRELQQALDDFQAWAQPAAGAATQEEDDAEVLQQLRELGYLE